MYLKSGSVTVVSRTGVCPPIKTTGSKEGVLVAVNSSEIVSSVVACSPFEYTLSLETLILSRPTTGALSIYETTSSVVDTNELVPVSYSFEYEYNS